MKIFYFLIFIVSITFSQNEIKHSDIIGEWEIKIKVKQLLEEEIKKLDMFEKIADKNYKDEDIIYASWTTP